MCKALRRSTGIESETSDTAPTTHGLSSIADLVAEAVSAGLPTTFRVVGEALSGIQKDTHKISTALRQAARARGAGAAE